MTEQEILKRGIYFIENEKDVFPDGYEKYIGGDHIWQHPLQLVSFLNWMQGKEIGKYLEIGIWKGGTFKLFCDVLKPKVKVAIDFVKKPEDFDGYFIQKSSLNVQPMKFDLVFIDGNHRMRYLINDWEKFGRQAKYCVFHDIINKRCSDVIKFWGIMRKKHRFVEFLDKYEGKEEGFGIGCLIL